MTVFLFSFLLVIIIFQATQQHSTNAKLRTERQYRLRATQRYDDLAESFDEQVKLRYHAEGITDEHRRQARRIEGAVSAILKPQ